MSRDNQKSKVYKAGDALRKQARWFKTKAQIQEFADKVTASESWTGPDRIEIRLTRRDAWKSYCCSKGHGGIALSPAAGVCDLILLHEMAHAIAWADESHGVEFCDAWLSLVREHIGEYTAIKLRQAFDENGVRYTKAVTS